MLVRDNGVYSLAEGERRGSSQEELSRISFEISLFKSRGDPTTGYFVGDTTALFLSALKNKYY